MNFSTFSHAKLSLFTFVILFVSCQITLAQLSETRKLGSFSKIHVSGALQVSIKQGNSEQVEITASNLTSDDIKTEIKGQTLYLGLKNGNYRNTKLKMTLTYRQLNRIEAQGAIEIKGLDAIRTNNFTLDTKGSSKVQLALEVNYLSVNCAGASSLHLKGNVKQQKITLNGASSVEAFDLTTQNTEVIVNGAGNFNTFVTQRLVASVNGAGNVRYKGNPTETQFKKSGAGNISAK